MDGDKVERLRERLLQCPVCMDEFRDPRLLPCHHTMCTDCIQNLLLTSTTGRMFRCPQCRRDVCVPRGGVAELPVNFFVRSLQDELGGETVVGPCQVCQRGAVTSQYRCLECDLDICHFCIHEHRLVKHKDSSTVNILRMEVSTMGGGVQGVANRTCNIHSEEMVQLFCETCQHPVCVSCSCGEHRKHKVLPLAQKLHKSRNSLQQQLEKLTKERRLMRGWQRQLDGAEVEARDNAKRTLAAIDFRTRELHRLIDHMARAVKDRVEHEEKLQLRDLATCREKIHMLLQRLDLGVSFLQGLQEGDVCLELLDAFKTFSTELDEVRHNVSSGTTVALCDHRFLAGHNVQYGKYMAATFGTLRSRRFFLRLGNAPLSFFQRVFAKPSVGQSLMLGLLVAMTFTIVKLVMFCYSSPADLEGIVALTFILYLSVAACFAYYKS
ncbi:hypothetical protein BaRGS_00029413 [Batillaria attramentaria]|uniref:Uncharacterized protein n=1 Tax=Batillaria attramentaria TaxID=370345 RepID=A0ABD0JXM4_9CAEN